MPEQSEAYRMGSPVRVNANFMTFHLSKECNFLASLGGEHASFFKRALVCSGNSKFVNDAVDVIRGRPMGLVTDEFNLGVFLVIGVARKLGLALEPRWWQS